MLRFLLAASVAAAAVFQPLAARAEDYFIPAPPKQAAPATRAPQRQTQRPAAQQPPQVAPSAQMPMGAAGGMDAQEPPPQLNVQLPPPPELPALPKAEPPPVGMLGVLGVPEVMRASIAAQSVERVIGERRNKLNEDAQREQAAWREMQQALANDRAKLSAEQIRARERELQERITNAQRQFRERNRIIQEAAQYALAQIERTLISVIRQVAESRGMNLVLHRAQVALNVNQFDITDQVAEQLNKIQASVVIPPDGVSPNSLPPLKATPPVAAAPAPSPAPAAAPASAPAAPAPAPANPPAAPAPVAPPAAAPAQ